MLFIILVILGSSSIYLYSTGKWEDIKNISFVKLDFNFSVLDSKIENIDPTGKNLNYLSYSNFNQFFNKLTELQYKNHLCEIVQNKINLNDPNKNFFIVDPQNLEIVDDFFIAKSLIFIDLNKKNVTLEKNYKISLYYKNAIFAIDNSIIQK